MSTYHVWGDPDFDFDELDRAGRYLSTLYRRSTGKTILWKEKYGTIRYEIPQVWLQSLDDESKFKAATLRTIKKFPKLAGEIIEDAWLITNTAEWDNFVEGVLFLHDVLNPETIERP